MSPLPPGLQQYRRQLERAIAADLARRRRRRLGGVAAAVAAVLVLVNLLPSGDDRPGVAPASAVERAAQALQPKRGTILHVHIVGRQFEDGRADVRWEDESWMSVGERALRNVQTPPEGPVAESAHAEGVDSLWDAAGDRVLEAPSDESFVPDDKFRSEALAMLDSGQARVEGRRRIDGRDALRIVAQEGSLTFLVDARDYTPIQLRTEGTSGGTVLRFVAYESLPLNDETRSLLSIAAQHPGAPVVRDAGAFRALQERLFAKG